MSTAATRAAFPPAPTSWWSRAGPEYRSHRGVIEIRPDETTAVTVPLQRYAELPAAGWFSGDSHVHLMRDRPEDDAVWGQIAAEDLYVANLLEMGNVAGTHFKQPAWGRAGRYARDGRVLVSGQEDPRTGQRGHTMHWNIERPVHEPDSFFEYHEIFENTRRQGGVTGYAHLGELFQRPPRSGPSTCRSAWSTSSRCCRAGG